MKTYAAEVTIEVPKPPMFRIEDIGKLIQGVIQIILVGAGLVAFLYLLMGGLQWITSGGDKAGVDAARQKILAALIGLGVVFATWALIRVLEAFLGVSIISGPIKIPTPFD